MNKFEETKFFIGDTVKIINRASPYYDCKAIIKDMNRFNDDSYYCDILSKRTGTVITSLWISRYAIMPLKKPKDEPFTISIRNHKRLNLNFKL